MEIPCWLRSFRRIALQFFTSNEGISGREMGRRTFRGDLFVRSFVRWLNLWRSRLPRTIYLAVSRQLAGGRRRGAVCSVFPGFRCDVDATGNISNNCERDDDRRLCDQRPANVCIMHGNTGCAIVQINGAPYDQSVPNTEIQYRCRARVFPR